MSRLQIKTWALFIFLSVAFNLPCASGADYDGGVKVTLIKKGTTASNGQKLAYPCTGKAEVTALIVEIPPGGNTGWHSHPFPVYAFVLSGTLTVEVDHGDPYQIKDGDVLFEVVNTPHLGKNLGKEPVRLAVFYTGIEGTPNTVKISR
ncbi:MAG: cupin domain-containing protein, partial [Syntrophales bacterium]|nr:cupin domain-containing protein [Syntrophales bacterium]